VVNLGFFVGMYVRRKWEGYGKQIFYIICLLHYAVSKTGSVFRLK